MEGEVQKIMGYIYYYYLMWAFFQNPNPQCPHTKLILSQLKSIEEIVLGMSRKLSVEHLHFYRTTFPTKLKKKTEMSKALLNGAFRWLNPTNCLISQNRS